MANNSVLPPRQLTAAEKAPVSTAGLSGLQRFAAVIPFRRPPIMAIQQQLIAAAGSGPQNATVPLTSQTVSPTGGGLNATSGNPGQQSMGVNLLSGFAQWQNANPSFDMAGRFILPIAAIVLWREGHTAAGAVLGGVGAIFWYNRLTGASGT
jgi:hypothetical protein